MSMARIAAKLGNFSESRNDVRPSASRYVEE
jgi:hypothetical protein